MKGYSFWGALAPPTTRVSRWPPGIGCQAQADHGGQGENRGAILRKSLNDRKIDLKHESTLKTLN
ncbi:MAG: hypothetical protein ACJAQT_004862 [Akkermansiaceae bacterium]|jgi:hypothetical protein